MRVSGSMSHEFDPMTPYRMAISSGNLTYSMNSVKYVRIWFAGEDCWSDQRHLDIQGESGLLHLVKCLRLYDLLVKMRSNEHTIAQQGTGISVGSIRAFPPS